MSYQRARRPEQKEERREAILAAARALAEERRVRDVSLGDVAREVGLAKSNLLRYFESREEIFLTLLLREWESWAAAVTGPDDLAPTLAARPFFCDLLGEQAAVLEHNVSADAVRAFRAASIALVEDVAARLEVPEPFEVVAAALLLAASLYPLANPSPAVREAYAGTDLLQPDFEGRLRGFLTALRAGYRR
ncbi:TetR family transcriptional regulator [Solirubrobacter phytolaccae]|uniref:TetR family transcriptional regulator n=1 Tax=Solirubrobacter phytolaccae TaxID=1404360 RepID=A0A9X3N9Z5_9ACTN|nr:TetR family transcriptional regulator [Solirubrobacter phytolaccae]MDA0181149.1 TetR family transcriptional regulator [Solirubrobacter phytolaccae]